ncbi:MAG TPA: hypothetical protein V6D22_21275 [Candidatus Obscuribacterales bacterium]
MSDEHFEGEGIRRPIAARSSSWAHQLAKFCAGIGLKPNGVSMIGLVFAIIAGTLLIIGNQLDPVVHIMCWIIAAFLVQARLCCNMIDGLMAVENQLGTATGVMFNEFPDRLEDSIILVCTGFACGVQPLGAHLGWLAALLAVLTAYVRAFGGSLGQPQNFCGPMAKPHRMATTSIAIIVGCTEFWFHQTSYILLLALVVICLGAAATCVRRALSIARLLQAQNP